MNGHEVEALFNSVYPDSSVFFNGRQQSPGFPDIFLFTANKGPAKGATISLYGADPNNAIVEIMQRLKYHAKKKIDVSCRAIGNREARRDP